MKKLGWQPEDITRPVYDGEDEDFIRYQAEGRFWGGGRMLRSKDWERACIAYKLPIWKQQDLLDHIEKESPGIDPETLTIEEIRVYCRQIFLYDRVFGAVYPICEEDFEKLKSINK